MTTKSPAEIRPSATRGGRLAELVTVRRRWVLVIGLVAVLVALALGSGAAGRLKPGGFSDPSAPSQVAADRLAASGLGEPNLVLLVTPKTGSLASPAVAAFGRRLTATVAATPGVRDVVSTWSSGQSGLESRDGRQALVLAYVTGDDAQVTKTGNAVIAQVASPPQGHAASSVATVQAGGLVGADHDVSTEVAKDLARAESLALPITLVLLVLAFGSLVAASLPVLIGLGAIAGSLAALDLLSRVTNVSIYALDLTIALGLGLAIDYSLLMVNRFREHLAAGLDTVPAVRATMATAGRTVAFSAVAVAAALSSLLVFPGLLPAVDGLRRDVGGGRGGHRGHGGLAGHPGRPRAEGERRADPAPGLPRRRGVGPLAGRHPLGDAPAGAGRPGGGHPAGRVRHPAPPRPLRHPRRPGAPDGHPGPPGGRRPADRLHPQRRRHRLGGDRPPAVERPGHRLRRAALHAVGDHRGGRPDRTLRPGPARPGARIGLAPAGRGDLALAGLDGRPRERGRRRPGGGGAVGAGSRRGHGRRRRSGGGTGRPEGRPGRSAAAGPGPDRPDHLRRLVPLHRERAPADQGPRAQRPHHGRRAGHHGVDLPGRAPLGPARLHSRRHVDHDADPPLRDRLRPVDGLRGVRALPGEGAPRRRLRRRHRRQPGPGSHRPDRDHGGGHHVGDLLRLRHLPHLVPAAAGPGHGHRHPGRRHAGPGRAGALDHAPGRPAQLVGPRPAAPPPPAPRAVRGRGAGSGSGRDGGHGSGDRPMSTSDG